MAVLMEINLLIHVLLSVVHIATADSCESGWQEYEGHCYYIGSQAVTWYEAREKCSNMSARLTSILNKDENDFLKSAKDQEGEYWIGLRNVSANFSNCCNWTDGHTTSWSNWRTKKPRAPPNCVKMAFKGKWRNANCTATGVQYTNWGFHNISFICKKDNISTAVLMTTEGLPLSAVRVLPVAIGVAAAIVVVVVVIVVTVAVVLYRKRRSARGRRSGATAENDYSDQPATAREPPLEMLPSNGTEANTERVTVTCSSGLDHDDRGEHLYVNGPVGGGYSKSAAAAAAVAENAANATQESGLEAPYDDGSQLYAVVRKKPRPVSETEIHENPNYATFDE